MKSEERKNQLLDIVNTNLEGIKKQKELIERQEEFFNKKIELIKSVDYFSKEEAKELIEYLVSNVEGKKYCVEKLHLDRKSSSYHIENMVTEYSLLYLVSEDKKEEAKKELFEKYDIKEIDGKNYINTSKIPNDISDTYVKLAFYNRYSDRIVKFEKANENHVISINIDDERFHYIYDYIEDVLNAKLDKPNFSVDIEREKIIADNFALMHKHKKKLILESE